MSTQENIKILFQEIIDRCYKTFPDPELRAFVCGGYYDNNPEGRKKLGIYLNNNLNKFSMFYGITNAIYAYLVAAFSDKMTGELAFAENKSRVSKFCVEGVEDALFGLYDTYDATDDLVKFVVFNAALAVGNDSELREDLGLEENTSFNERYMTKTFPSSENLLGIFRWMFNLRKQRAEIRNMIIRDQQYAETLKKLLHLMDYASFLSTVCLVRNGDTGSYDFVLQNGKGRRIKSNYVIFHNGCSFYLLRSVETEKNNESSISLKYSPSNDSESATKTTWEMVEDTFVAKEGDTTYRIKVRSVGETYSEITNGLIRKRSRSTFCGGLSGYKYYTELAASVIDAIEVITASRRGKSVVTYLTRLIKNPKNFSICKDECVCTRPSCRMGDMSLCQGQKSFDLPIFDQGCLANMRLLPILTLLLIVAGSKSILPQIFECITDNPNPDDLFNELNNQLSLRFTKYSPEAVVEEANQICDNTLAKSSLTFSTKDMHDLPTQLIYTLYKLKARAYTVAIVNELERIENSLDGRSAKTKSGNIGNYSIKEMFDAMGDFCTEPSDDNFEAFVKYAKHCLRRVLMTVLCYYRGLAACVHAQFDYEISLENSMKDGTVDTAAQSAKIKEAFFEGVQVELRRLEGEEYREHPHIPTFFELFRELRDLNDHIYEDQDQEESKFIRAINLGLGRDMLDVHELLDLVQLKDEIRACRVKGSKKTINLDVDPKKENVSDYILGIKEIIGYFYDGNTDCGIGIYPQVLTFSSTMINRDGNIIRKFAFSATESRNSHAVREDEYNVFSFFDYEINKQYFYVPPKKCENSNWLTHPILIGCSEFIEAVFGNMPKENDDER